MAWMATGTTRRVLLLGPYALKIARRKADGGAAGRRCNLAEAQRSREETPANRAILCPVVACTSKGTVLVQRRARMLTQAEFDRHADAGELPEWEYVPRTQGSPIEEKASSYGYLSGRIVAVDYAAHELISQEEMRRAMDEDMRRLLEGEP